MAGMNRSVLCIAALTLAISASGNEIQLLPAGEFTARDGRPADCKSWVLDDAAAAALIALAEQRATPFVIDYEHQTLLAKQNGQPAPAAGWFKQLEWRAGDGLYAVNVEWTDRAGIMIAAKEYKFISPVFLYDQQGRVQEILMAAITNNPALDGLNDVMLAAATRMVSLTPQTAQESVMDELMVQLRWMLNLPVGATAEDIQAQLQKLIDQLKAGGAAAAGIDLASLLQGRDQQIATLSANQADPARFVPVETMRALQQQIATLTAQAGVTEANGLITAALADGRLLPAQESWARGLATSNLASLSAYLDSAPKIPALHTPQRTSAAPAPRTGDLDTDTLAVCTAFGNNPEDVKKTLALETGD